MERVNKIKENAKNHEFGKYLCYQISVSGVAYLSGEDKENKIIKILLPSGEVRDIEQYSNVINGLTSSSYKKIDRLYYSGELDE
jgi:hypothetical protein